MRVFLSEYLTSGAFPGDDSIKATLAVEGAAMLRALASDAAAMPGWQVAVTWDAVLEPFGIPAVEVHLASSKQEERRMFERLAAEADATLVIAPEFDRLLEERCRLVEACGGRSAGSTPEAIALCADKLELARHLGRYGVPTIETRRCDFEQLEDQAGEAPSAGFVVKPRDGAGSVETFRVRSRAEVAEARAAFGSAESISEPIEQPFVCGRAVSVAAIVSRDRVEVLPVCEQHIAGSNRLHYTGGSVPAATSQRGEIEALARRAIASIPGLAGYVGLDVILPEGGSDPLIVEINPRLTSSYHGYRRLASRCLAQRIIDPAGDWPAVEWQAGRVDFLADGTTTFRDPIDSQSRE